MLQAIVSVIPIPIKHPDILPIELLNGVLASSMPYFLRVSTTFPSNKPAMASVIASPTAPPTIAPRTPAKLAPIRAATPRRLVSIVPNIISAPTDFMLRPEIFSGIHGKKPNPIKTGPIKVFL